MINTLNKIIPFVIKDVRDFDKFRFGIFYGRDYDVSIKSQDKSSSDMDGIEAKSKKDVGKHFDNETANFLKGINFLGDDGLKPLHVPDDDLVSKKSVE